MKIGLLNAILGLSNPFYHMSLDATIHPRKGKNNKRYFTISSYKFLLMLFMLCHIIP